MQTPAAAPEVRLVNSPRIALNYEIKDKGPSGVSEVELWYTQDGRSWNKCPLPKPTDEQGFTSPLTFAVDGEGVYGFTLVARNGNGLSIVTWYKAVRCLTGDEVTHLFTRDQMRAAHV